MINIEQLYYYDFEQYWQYFSCWEVSKIAER